MKSERPYINLNMLSEVEVYKLVLSAKIKYFPAGFWNYKTHAVTVIKYLIEEVLKWGEDDIKENLTNKTFQNNKLAGMLQSLFKGSAYKAIQTVYPNRFKPWELKQAPKSTWDQETCIEATKWLIEEKLKWSRNDIIENYCTDIFNDYGLRGMIKKYRYSVFLALNSAYPNEFKPWELKNAPCNDFERGQDFWNRETGIEATKWLIEGKLRWSRDDIINNISQKTFFENGLRGMLNRLYEGSPYGAINAAYPGVFEQSDFIKKTSKYIGIFKYEKKNPKKPWGAVIRKDNKQYHLGYFVTEEEAAEAYDLKAIFLFGESVKVNFEESKGKFKTMFSEII